MSTHLWSPEKQWRNCLREGEDLTVNKQVHTAQALGTSSYPMASAGEGSLKTVSSRLQKALLTTLASVTQVKSSGFTLAHLRVHFQTHRNHGEESTLLLPQWRRRASSPCFHRTRTGAGAVSALLGQTHGEKASRHPRVPEGKLPHSLVWHKQLEITES